MVDHLANPNSKPYSLSVTQTLAQEFADCRDLYEAQAAMTQRYLEAQARTLAEALIQRASQVRFVLPEQIIAAPGRPPAHLPQQMQEQLAGGLIGTLTGSDIRAQVRHRLAELEDHENTAMAAAARLLRFATASHMIYGMLPSGRPVTYLEEDGEAIPSIPAGTEDTRSALTAETDAIVEVGSDDQRGELIVPYVPYARRFYLPQWVAFDADGDLLVKSTAEAEAHLASMQRFLEILHAAAALAPYMIADEEYQRKRYGILGQLVNQGRALALYETGEIIETIKRRAAEGELNRGLSLSLPYFDDQLLALKTHNFQVIPAGRIMFVPAFVVRATEEEQAKVAQDTRLSPSTRKYLLRQLELLQQAFLPADLLR
jgi:hypothetical protein